MRWYCAGRQCGTDRRALSTDHERGTSEAARILGRRHSNLASVQQAPRMGARDVKHERQNEEANERTRTLAKSGFHFDDGAGGFGQVRSMPWPMAAPSRPAQATCCVSTRSAALAGQSDALARAPLKSFSSVSTSWPAQRQRSASRRRRWPSKAAAKFSKRTP